MFHIPQYVTYTTICFIYHNMLHIPQYVTYTTICYIYHNNTHYNTKIIVVIDRPISPLSFTDHLMKIQRNRPTLEYPTSFE